MDISLEDFIDEGIGQDHGYLRNAEVDMYDYVIAGVFCFFVALYFFFVSSECRYWGLLPIMACGTLSSSDIIAWFRRRFDVFDPKALAAAFFFLTTFLAPLLHLQYDQYGRDLYIFDWRFAFGQMALFNFLGLVIYKWLQGKAYSRTAFTKTFWQIDTGRFAMWVFPILAISFLSAMVIRFFFGGLIKIEGETQISAAAAGYTAYLSIFRMLGDPFVLILMAYIIFNIRQKKMILATNTTWRTVLFLICITAVSQFLMVGLRGSRSVILSTIIAVGIIIHFTLKRFTRKWILVAFAMIFTFLYLYDFRKKAGLVGFRAFYDTQIRKSIQQEYGGYSPAATLLGDLSRADLQALMLANLTRNKDEIQYKPVWGKTYAMAFLTFIPRAIWKDKPVGIKKDAGTEIQGLLRGEDKSTRQYGLTGEAMLNFGYWGIIPAFSIFGLMMGYFRKKLYTMHIHDARFYIFPLIILMLQNMVIQDSDNWIFALLRDGVLLFILITLSSMKIRLQDN
jgi:hypothetical protein